MPWFVLKTKHTSEKKVTAQLQEMQMEAYCPVRTEIRQWSDRKKKVKVPLLPSMILVNCEDTERQKVFTVPNVRRYLYWLGKPAVVTENEVEALRSFENDDYRRCDLVAIEPGKKIDLSSIGMAHQQGVVKYVSGDQCWVVLDNLGYVVKLQLEN